MATDFDDLKMLQSAEKFVDDIWQHVQKWNAFDKKTVGEQLVRSADSIGANIAEGFGRFHYGEKLQFLYYARGSLYETKYWINRCKQRNLLSDEIAETYSKQLSQTAIQINRFAASLKKQKKMKRTTNKIAEPIVEYRVAEPASSLVHDELLNWLEN